MYEHSEIKRFSIPGPCLITPKAFADARGLFSENWREDGFCQLTGNKTRFVQDNLSVSAKAGTIRGLHAQRPPHALGKLVQVLRGAVMDVAVDIRRNSPTYGRHIAVRLDENSRNQFWIPEGFLHGYETLEDNTLVYYKQTGYYQGESEICIRFDDPKLAIDWTTAPERAIVSDKDAQAPGLGDFESPF